MSLRNLLETIPFLNRVNNVLVGEADLVGIKATVFQRQGEMVTITQECHADSLELQVAVNELVQQARKQGWDGKHAVLLTPAVAQAVIELPIPPKHKLSPQQVAESVRWEMEPFVSQHMRLFGLGQILLANHFIKPEQITEILNQQEAANVSKNKAVVYKRFGELAVEMGFASQAQVDKALLRQAWLLGSGEDIQCGWAPQAGAESSAGSHAWLGSAMNKHLLRQWQAAFSALEIKLDACYALSGNTATGAGLDKKDKKPPKPELIFELHEGLVTGTHLQNADVKQQQTLAFSAENLLSTIADVFHRFGLDEIEHLSLVDVISKSEKNRQQLTADIETVIGHKVHVLTPPTPHTGIGMLSVARDYLRMKDSRPLAAVSVNEPSPPPLQRTEVRMALGAVTLLILLGVTEGMLQARQYWIEAESAKVEQDLGKINAAISRIQKKVDTVKKLKQDIKDRQAEIKDVNRSIELLANDLPKRNQTVYEFLNQIDRTISEDVVIDRISEDTILGFTVSAWAISESSAQEFVRHLQVALHPMGFKLKDITVTSQTGRLGLMGYAIQFGATTLSDDVWANAKQLSKPNAGNQPSPNSGATAMTGGQK